MSARSSTRCLRLDRPAPFKPDDPPLLLPRVDDEDERVAEPVVEALAGRVGEPQPEMEATFGERERPELEPNRALALAAVPSELAEVHCLARDEHSGIVTELQLEPWRRDAVRGTDPYSKRERLAGQVLETLAALGA